MTSMWQEVWEYFGHPNVKRDDSCYDIVEDKGDADYVYGWYSYMAKMDEDISVGRNPSRKMGWEDAKEYFESRLDEH